MAAVTDGVVARLRDGAAVPRPPFIPLLGDVVLRLAQVPADRFDADAQTQAAALDEVCTAIGADVVCVGLRGDARTGADAIGRLQPLLAGRGIGACLHSADATAARAYCEAGTEILFLVDPDCSEPRRFKTVANVGTFYRVPVLLVRAGPDTGALAHELGLHGAVVERPSGDEPGIVGGGLPAPGDLRPPRAAGFFWSFAGEVPAHTSAESLVALGRQLRGEGA